MDDPSAVEVVEPGDALIHHPLGLVFAQRLRRFFLWVFCARAKVRVWVTVFENTIDCKS